MGVTKEQKQQARHRLSKQVSGRQKYPNMFTFHPTAEQKKLLKSSPMDLEKDLENADTFLSRGCVLSIGQRLDTGSCYATMREKTDNWKEARAVSAWHAEPAKALKALMFILTSELAEFPEVEFKPSSFDEDW